MQKTTKKAVNQKKGSSDKKRGSPWVLFGKLLGKLARNDGDEFPVRPRQKRDLARGEGKQGIVPSESDIASRMILRSALAHEDRSRRDEFSVAALYSKILWVAVPSIGAASLPLLVGEKLNVESLNHDVYPPPKQTRIQDKNWPLP